ncbi:preprotein translocase subunit SecE [Helcococcus ovis]|uniref:Protein translocase subunit SecE n=1 Tax=Helcococcus ovis TaxID=72026 RepID=A0A4R9C0P3_9FIRM|nr:preprotein translocase subunit SecE [Helcococcus ovis]TFF65127.1 preprotein translocase subunit SecE [Helcococcus ovis]TFF66370.1 preprotein translocase subunit SecE [Helcococcus ovis]TFF68681.1 preprotein translocase subunit SecE [Helcococcus ovis]WNZ01621.1 preprotein translocase subunit SecE [Helcococcus ovis]
MSTEKKGFLKGIRSEYGKIAWPTKSELLKATFVVIVTIAVVSAVTKLLDMLFGFILSFTV